MWPLGLGKLSVDAFFVLSGFLIVTAWDRRPQVGHFALRRVKRLWPAYLVAVVVLVPLVAPEVLWSGRDLLAAGHVAGVPDPRPHRPGRRPDLEPDDRGPLLRPGPAARPAAALALRALGAARGRDLGVGLVVGAGPPELRHGRLAAPRPPAPVPAGRPRRHLRPRGRPERPGLARGPVPCGRGPRRRRPGRPRLLPRGQRDVPPVRRHLRPRHRDHDRAAAGRPPVPPRGPGRGG